MKVESVSRVMLYLTTVVSYFVNRPPQMDTPSAALFLAAFIVFSGNYGNIEIHFGAAGQQNVTFQAIKNVGRFNGYIASSNYIQETRLTGNDRTQCAAQCILMTGCLSFFLDTNTSVCQFHRTVIGTKDGLTPSPSSLYFQVGLSTVCQESWYSFLDSCYAIDNSTLKTFDDATTYCQQLGGYVLRLDSTEENSFIKGVLSNLTSLSIGYWIGLVDVSQSNTWIWNETGQAPTFTDWGGGQPQVNDEFCAFYYYNGFTWHDVSCGSLLQTICEVS